MNLKYKCFFLGYLFCVGARMFSQDIRGLERYVDCVRAGWVELSPV